MKLYHRSDFWGSRILGRRFLAHDGIAARVIHIQAVLPELNLPHWGCCKHIGKRVVEVKEQHFLDHSREMWDLYEIGNSCQKTNKGGGQSVFTVDYCLMPSISTFIPLPTWRHVGPVNPCMARMDLEFLLHPVLRQNLPNERPKHHVHIALVMDSLEQKDFRLVTAHMTQKRAAAFATAAAVKIAGEAILYAPVTICC